MFTSTFPRLLAKDDSALDIEISEIEDKGRGILALRDFKKGEFVVEYAGDLINIDDAKVSSCNIIGNSIATVFMILLTFLMILLTIVII